MVKIIQFSANGQAQAIFMQVQNNARAAHMKSRRGPGQLLSAAPAASPGSGTFLQSRPLRERSAAPRPPSPGAVIDGTRQLRSERHRPRKRRAFIQIL